MIGKTNAFTQSQVIQQLNSPTIMLDNPIVMYTITLDTNTIGGSTHGHWYRGLTQINKIDCVPYNSIILVDNNNPLKLNIVNNEVGYNNYCEFSPDTGYDLSSFSYSSKVIGEQTITANTVSI